MSEYLLLKWGTLKGWDIGENGKARAALARYASGPTSVSLLSQSDTADQKAALCELIDAINGPIRNDWSGEDMSKDDAKKYVMEYPA
ncbi:hypothetical protein GCM10011385_40080 [Nitratireductor aestuarii]|uniref:Uncharacterized protein n=1 Tax=Nitratireductor aestuarii TaxID=1735103 RepID=A0A916S523_9HYPH|nr:hypothetical protein [Nitratireductor aestuarii]GGA81831.1 hypothetical protein GCM10011385_40080 [Nitratireductor aestuarii]